MSAGVLEAAGTNVEGTTLFLCGNIHARRDRVSFVPEPNYQPAGSIISASHERVISLNAVTAGGAAWNNTQEGAGVHPVGGSDRGSEPFIELDAAESYDGILYVPEFTHHRRFDDGIQRRRTATPTRAIATYAGNPAGHSRARRMGVLRG